MILIYFSADSTASQSIEITNNYEKYGFLFQGNVYACSVAEVSSFTTSIGTSKTNTILFNV